MTPTLKERTRETNIGLIKPFETPQVSYAPQTAMFVNGKFQNWDFRTTLPPGVPRLPERELADKTPMFKFTEPRHMSGAERSGYELGKGLKNLENDIAQANEYKEYLGAKTLADVRHGAPVGSAFDGMDVSGSPEVTETPAPRGTDTDGASFGVSNNFGGGGRRGASRTAPSGVTVRDGMDVRPDSITYGDVASGSRSNIFTSNRPGFVPSNADAYRDAPDVTATVREPPRLHDPIVEARRNRLRDPQTAPSGTFAVSMNQLTDSLHKQLRIDMNRNVERDRYDPDFMNRMKGTKRKLGDLDATVKHKKRKIGAPEPTKKRKREETLGDVSNKKRKITANEPTKRKREEVTLEQDNPNKKRKVVVNAPTNKRLFSITNPDAQEGSRKKRKY